MKHPLWFPMRAHGQAFPLLGLLAMATAMLCLPARADGLSDLRAALTRLQSTTPVKATLEIKLNRRAGEGKKMEEIAGAANISIEDNAAGLQMGYSKDLIAKLGEERKKKSKDKDAPNPLTKTVNSLGVLDALDAVRAAGDLQKSLEGVQLKSEKPDMLNGKPVRLLTFSKNIDSLGEKAREYVKSFDASMELWIDEDGHPLQGRNTQTGSGSAFFVINFSTKSEETTTYGLVGDRLFIQRQETHAMNNNSLSKENEEVRIVKTLTLR